MIVSCVVHTMSCVSKASQACLTSNDLNIGMHVHRGMMQVSTSILLCRYILWSR